MFKSTRATHEPKLVTTDAAEELEKQTTDKPTESNHPKCKDLVVAYGRRSLTRIEPQEVSFENKTGHTYFKEENLLHAIFKLRYRQSTTLWLFLPQEIRKLVKRSLARV